MEYDQKDNTQEKWSEWNKDFHIYKTTFIIQNSSFTNSFQHCF